MRLLSLIVLVSCQTLPNDVPEVRTITSPRILEIRSQPHIVHSGDTVTFDALVVDKDGNVVSTPDIEWRICDPEVFDAELFPACDNDHALILAGNVTSFQEVANFFSAISPCLREECAEDRDTCGVAFPKVDVRVMATAEVNGETITAVRTIGATPIPISDYEREVIPDLGMPSVVALAGNAFNVVVDQEGANLWTCPPDLSNEDAVPSYHLYANGGGTIFDPEIISAAPTFGAGTVTGGAEIPSIIHLIARTPRGQSNWVQIDVP